MLPASLEQTAVDDQVSSLGQKQRPEPSSDSINSGLSVTSQVPNPIARPVDRRTIEGSTPGDFRSGGDTAASSIAAISNAPGPRGETTNDESAGA